MKMCLSLIYMTFCQSTVNVFEGTVSRSFEANLGSVIRYLAGCNHMVLTGHWEARLKG